jgi:class 3 adenylate cyclase
MRSCGVRLAAGCVAAVLEMQQALAAHAWPGGERVLVRMGIHCGEAARTATGLVGLEVHRAARVAAVGYGGQVLVSEAAAVLVRDGLPPGAALPAAADLSPSPAGVPSAAWRKPDPPRPRYRSGCG